MLRREALLAMFAAILAVPGVAGAITPDQVLIVVNDRAPISERIGEYYPGWGSNDPAEMRRAPGFHWLRGAIASWFVSSSARTFVRPPQEWTIGSWEDPRTFYAGSPQSLIGALIAEGVTGAVGFVYEP